MVSPARRKFPPASELKRRKVKTRELGYQIFVFCEGKTEKLYLDAVAREFRHTGVVAEVVGERGVPMTVVEEACKKHTELALQATRTKSKTGSQTDCGFEVWAMCDRDEHPNFHRAAERAAQSGVGFAWSNPCCELWALLQLRDQTAHIERHPCQSELHEVMPGYHHGKSPVFDGSMMTVEHRATAIARALNLHRRAQDAGDPMGNPTTALWKVVRALEFGSSRAARAAADAASDPSLPWWLPTDPGV